MKRTRSTAGPAPASQRQLRVAEQIRHSLVDMLQREQFRDPVLAEANWITVTAVEIGPDLKHATAFVMPLGGKNADVLLEALNRAAGFFRSAIAAKMDLRYAPKVSFRLDHSFDEASRIESLLRQDNVQKDLAKNLPEDDDAAQ